MIYDIAAYQREQRGDDYHGTVTTRILNTMQSLRLDQTNMRVTLDAEGRILSGDGTVRIMVTDLYGVEHTLDIAFNATAGSYGSSEVETFDPEAYNVVSSQEYYENYESTPPSPRAIRKPLRPIPPRATIRTSCLIPLPSTALNIR